MIIILISISDGWYYTNRAYTSYHCSDCICQTTGTDVMQSNIDIITNTHTHYAFLWKYDSYLGSIIIWHYNVGWITFKETRSCQFQFIVYYSYPDLLVLYIVSNNFSWCRHTYYVESLCLIQWLICVHTMISCIPVNSLTMETYSLLQKSNFYIVNRSEIMKECIS
jgi:hypothetical protein